jgi:hypothetical protein
VKDPRYRLQKQGIAYNILTVVGLALETNRLIDTVKYKELRFLLVNFIKKGRDLDNDSFSVLREQLDEVRKLIVRKSDIILITFIVLGTGLYSTQTYKDCIVVTDEVNKSAMPNLCMAIAHLVPCIIILVGDPNQLLPFLLYDYGYQKFRSTSLMNYFLSGGYQYTLLDVQRRLVATGMDLISEMFYGRKAKDHPTLSLPESHPYTRVLVKTMFRILIGSEIRIPMANIGPNLYFNLPGAITTTEPILCSKVNYQHYVFVINIITALMDDGVSV